MTRPVRYLPGGIRTRIGVLILVIVTGILTLEEGYDFLVTRSAVNRELEALAERAVIRLASNLEFPLWELDESWASKVIDTEMLDRNVYAIQVEGEGGLVPGKMRDAAGRPVPVAGKITGDLVQRQREVLHNGVPIGRVKLYITRHFATERFREEISHTLGLTLVMGVAIVLTLVWALNRVVIRPLRTIAEAVKAVAAGDYSRDITVGQRDEIGQLADGFNGMQRSIRQRESELRESRAKYRDLYDKAPDMYVSVDARTGRVRECNQTLVAELGYPREEVVGRPVFDLYHPDCRDAAQRAFQAFIASGRVRDEELVLRRRDGSRMDVSLNVSAVRDAVGAIVHSRSTWRDITERKRMQRELITLNEQLERRVAERTADLEQSNRDLRWLTRDLRDSKAAAEAANRAKSVFLANMSHELRTPLNAILGFAQLLARDHGLDAGQRRSIATINRSGRHLLDLINDVLQISRIEAGRERVEHEPLDLAELLESVRDMAAQRAEQAGLTLQVDLAPDLPRYLLGDARHLRQVLLNLIGNAVKFTSVGRVGLRVERHEDELGFTVSDTGPGIPEAEQKRIFEPFYQTEVGQSRGEGAGLGLFISHQYVQLMGGGLRLESIPGAGATFSFRLPLEETQRLPVGSEAPPLAVGLAVGQVPPRVLVAEDDADSRELLCGLLASVGYAVRSAGEGAQALDIFARWRPAFVWMDMRMPVLDGYEATRRMRQLPFGGEAVIVAQTASAFHEDCDAILAAGCDEVMVKPLAPDAVLELMGRRLRVAYRYADDASAPDVEQGDELDLSGLPSEWLARLRRAALELDVEAGQALIDELRATHPAEAKGLANLLEDYRFDRIVAACEGGGGEGHVA